MVETIRELVAQQLHGHARHNVPEAHQGLPSEGQHVEGIQALNTVALSDKLLHDVGIGTRQVEEPVRFLV